MPFPCDVSPLPRLPDTIPSFVYGGSANSTLDQNSLDYTDVFILSLPSFHWFKAPDSNMANQPRSNHHCQLIGKRQMLVIGGRNPSSSHWNTDTDPWLNGLGIFDITALEWSTYYNATAPPYVPSQMVEQYYTTNK